MSEQGIDIAGGPVEHVTPDEVLDVCHAQPRHPMRTVAIAKWPSECARLARRLGRGFTMIEEVEGKFLARSPRRSTVVSRMRSADADGRVRGRMRVRRRLDIRCNARSASWQRASLIGVRFDRLPAQRDAIERLLVDASPAVVLAALRSIAGSKASVSTDGRLGTAYSTRFVCARRRGSDRPPSGVVQTRNQLRVRGRYPESRILARPLLIKGLEFDYAVVTDPSEYNAHELYVSLTRGSRGLTIVSETSHFAPRCPG